jgi:nucleoside-diphosphate-sugar epimerase
MDCSASGESLSGMAFNIGSTEEVSVLELQKRLFETVQADASWNKPLPAVEFSQGYHGDAARRWPDTSLAAIHLEWHALTDLKHGLALTWAALR